MVYSDVSSLSSRRGAMTPPPRLSRNPVQSQPYVRSITPPPRLRGSRQPIDDDGRSHWSEQSSHINERTMNRNFTPPPRRSSDIEDWGAPPSVRSDESDPRLHVSQLKNHVGQGKQYIHPADRKVCPYAGLESERFEENFFNGFVQERRGKAVVEGADFISGLASRTGAQKQRAISPSTDSNSVGSMPSRMRPGAGKTATELSYRSTNHGKHVFTTTPHMSSSVGDIIRADYPAEMVKAANSYENLHKGHAGQRSQFLDEAKKKPKGAGVKPTERSQGSGKKIVHGKHDVDHVGQVIFNTDMATAETPRRDKRPAPSHVRVAANPGGNYDWGNVPDEDQLLEEASRKLLKERGDEDSEEGFIIGSQMRVKVYTRKPKIEGILPTIYVSHGPGALVLAWDKQLPVMRNMSKLFDKSGVRERNVSAILVISAHWEQAQSEGIDIEISNQSGAQRLECDFSGARPPAYENAMSDYCPIGDPLLCARIEKLLSKAGFKCAQNRHRFLDSGVWIPLLQMPEYHGVPVVQVSLPGTRVVGRDLDGSRAAKECLEMGRALRPLRKEGVLIVGSGMAIKGSLPPLQVDRWCRAIKSLCTEAPDDRRWNLLQHWQQLPYARQAHPQEENLLPLLVASGAAEEEPCKCIGDFRLGNTAMIHFKFGHPVHPIHN